jgi:hypothetical protein
MSYLNFPDYGIVSGLPSGDYGGSGGYDFGMGGDWLSNYLKGLNSDGTTPVVPQAPVEPPNLGESVDIPEYVPTPTPDPTPENPNNNPDLGYDPISGNPIGTGPTPEQGGDLPPNYVPPPNSRDWLGHVLTPTNSLLPQQLERSGPIRRVTPVEQLFNNPISGQRGVPQTAMSQALRSGSVGSTGGQNG